MLFHEPDELAERQAAVLVEIVEIEVFAQAFRAENPSNLLSLEN